MKPKLIVINGLPASGKSTLAQYISETARLPIFAKDDFKELLADSTGFLEYEQTRKFGKVSYEILFLIARKCLAQKVSLIIEGNFTLGMETLEFVSNMKALPVDTYEIHCFAKGQILVDRFLSRKRHPVHRSLDSSAYKAYAETLRAEKLPPLGLMNYIEVDTSDPESIDYERITTFLASPQ